MVKTLFKSIFTHVNHYWHAFLYRALAIHSLQYPFLGKPSVLILILMLELIFGWCLASIRRECFLRNFPTPKHYISIPIYEPFYSSLFLLGNPANLPYR